MAFPINWYYSSPVDMVSIVGAVAQSEELDVASCTIQIFLNDVSVQGSVGQVMFPYQFFKKGGE